VRTFCLEHGSRRPQIAYGGWYDPTTGTFLTRDPVDGQDGTPTVANPYHYVNNDPLNLQDPLGLRPTDQEGVNYNQLVRALLLAEGATACQSKFDGRAAGVVFESLTPTSGGGCSAVGYACANKGWETGGGIGVFGCERMDGLLDILQFTGSAAAGILCGMAAAPSVMGAGAAGAACAGATDRYMSGVRGGMSIGDALLSAIDPRALAFDAAIGALTAGVLNNGIQLLKSGTPIKGVLRRLCAGGRMCGDAGSTELPSRLHHWATNKSGTYTARLEKIASRYGLSLDDAWNTELLPHLGRHPNAYHEFVLDGMEAAAKGSGGSQAKFLELFDLYVKQPVRDNPELLRKLGWE